ILHFTLMAHCTSGAIRGSVSCSRALRQGIELATIIHFPTTREAVCSEPLRIRGRCGCLAVRQHPVCILHTIIILHQNPPKYTHTISLFLSLSLSLSLSHTHKHTHIHTHT